LQFQRRDLNQAVISTNILSHRLDRAFYLEPTLALKDPEKTLRTALINRRSAAVCQPIKGSAWTLIISNALDF
jgi:hypothetical protein